MKIDLTIFDQISNVSVLVVGDVMLDRYLFGGVQRISPEAPVPVVKVSREEEKIGGAANVAKNISQLGAKVGVLGVVGCDENAASVSSFMSEEGIVDHLIAFPDEITITKTRVLAQNQQVVRLDNEIAFSEAASQKLSECFMEIVNTYDVVLFSDYDKGSLRELREMIAVAREKGKTVLVDPKSSDLSKYIGAEIITPNIAEFQSAGGSVSSENEILASARSLMAQHDIGSMLLTRSEHGMTYITPKSETHFDVQVVDVNDVTGAGDTVIAVMAVFLGAGLKAEEACLLANTAAGIVVCSLGAAFVSPRELTEKLVNRGQALNVASTTSSLVQIRKFQASGKKIVFTNGCFDILHPGHVRYLAQARALGDYLVVGLNTDASVKRLKGDSRPVFSWDDRAYLLAGLSSVDWILPFGDAPAEKDTPQLLIEQITPDFLVKGGDYELDNIVGAGHVLKTGGQVKILNFEDGQSTSLIISKIQTRS